MSVIHSRTISRKIARRRAGLSFLDRRRPKAERPSGLQDVALRSTVRLPECRLILAPPAPMPLTQQGLPILYDRTDGLATRRPPQKKRKTARGWTVFRNVIVHHESELEHRVSLRLQARNDVAELHSQFPVFNYRDDEGNVHKHISDFCVQFKDGTRRAIIVKNEKKRDEMEALIDRIKADASADQVDDILLRTETYGTIEALENAMMIRWSREYHHQPDVDELQMVVSCLHGWFRFGSLLKNCEHLERRRVAVWRLLDAGVLFSVTGEKITELSFLAHAPGGGPTGLFG